MLGRAELPVLLAGIFLLLSTEGQRRHNGINVANHRRRGFKVHLHSPSPMQTSSSPTSFNHDSYGSSPVTTTLYSHTSKSTTQDNLYNPPRNRNFVPHIPYDSNKLDLKVGIVLPRQIFQQRRYQSVIGRSLENIASEREDGKSGYFQLVRSRYNFDWKSGLFRLEDKFDSINFAHMEVSPPPADIAAILCDQMANGSSAIIYFTNTEKFGRSTASTQYFLQMAGFLGIPVIAWNADNSGLETRSNIRIGSELAGYLQLAPSVAHQVSALLSILDRYNWNQFGIVTSDIAGHDDFVQAVRDQVDDALHHSRSRYVIQNVIKVSESNNWSVEELTSSEVRIILLYCTQSEASIILEKAFEAGLTSHNYLWLVTQSIIGDPSVRSSHRKNLPVGMLGIHFEVDQMKILEDFVSLAMRVFFRGVESMIKKKKNNFINQGLQCQSVNDSYRWKQGPEFFRQMLNLTMTTGRGKLASLGKQGVFNLDGSLRHTELKIMNFKPRTQHTDLEWEEVGTWNTWNGLDIKDIVWPGGSHLPPQGVPEKFYIKITFLEEPPFIILSDPDPISSKCSMNRGVPCYMSEFHRRNHENSTKAFPKCCSGLCIDLLRKFEDELGFTYDLIRVEDPKWGTMENGKWNGLMEMLVNKKTDLVLSSLKINAEREAAVDFTIPFLESGVAIVVAKRTGIISPTAFLEPFDIYSWMLVAMVAIQASAFSIFFFEWLSPSGYNMQVVPSKSNHRFSLVRTYWLVWAVLFQASVQVDCPRGVTARFMSSIWALFAVVFLALYTANLAAFMIPRKEYHDLSGLDDRRISNPMSQKPALKFGTLPYSYSQVTLQKHYSSTFNYMKKYNIYNTMEGAIRAVKAGELDAFIYDGTVLNYLVSQDEECRLLQVGSWSGMTGYALALPQHSKYKKMFNQKILELRENGDLERLSRYWMSGSCNPNEQEKRASEPLSIAQFLSAFLLLGIGLLSSVVFLILEHLYVRYLQNHLRKTKASGCFSLISLSIGQNYKLRKRAESRSSSYDPFVESEPGIRNGPTTTITSITGNSVCNDRCGDDFCNTKLNHLEKELTLAREKILDMERQLESYGEWTTVKKKEMEEKETVL